jgi:hypothetical protein
MNPHRPRQQDKHKEPSKSKGKPAAAHTETAPAPEHPVLKLQRTIGNKGTRDLLGRPIRRRATRPSAPRRRSIIQRFESDEHMALGNEATRGEHGEIRSVQLAADYTITYGEMVALAGDFFGSIDEMRTLAANEGSGEGTREEIEYARVVKVHGDGGRANTFSEAARTAVEQRYYRLATNNRSHFLNPAAGDAARSVTDKADDVTEPYRAQWNAAMPAVTQGAPLNAGAGCKISPSMRRWRWRRSAHTS